MIESKSFPSKVRINKKGARFREGESREDWIARNDKCNKLYGVLLSLENSLKNNSDEMNRLFSERASLQRELKRLRDDQAFRRRIDILFQTIGLMLTGGSANAVRVALGQAMGLVGTVIGLPTSRHRIRSILRDIGNKTNEFERRRRNHEHLLRDIVKATQPYKELDCKPNIARKF